ncbi:MAG: hypothetical protein DDT27_00722 [Dehalococcoidia bacterium]|nr:hypothetical protein [Chloroflexota bacterium]
MAIILSVKIGVQRKYNTRPTNNIHFPSSKNTIFTDGQLPMAIRFLENRGVALCGFDNILVLAAPPVNWLGRRLKAEAV